MVSRLRNRLRRDEGQALTELSLTAGFLCLMLLAVWQIGTVFSNYIDLSEAAREGARCRTAACRSVSSTRRQYASITFGFPEDSPLVICISGPNPDSVAVRLTII